MPPAQQISAPALLFYPPLAHQTSAPELLPTPASDNYSVPATPPTVIEFSSITRPGVSLREFYENPMILDQRWQSLPEVIGTSIRPQTLLPFMFVVRSFHYLQLGVNADVRLSVSNTQFRRYAVRGRALHYRRRPCQLYSVQFTQTRQSYQQGMVLKALLVSCSLQWLTDMSSGCASSAAR